MSHLPSSQATICIPDLLSTRLPVSLCNHQSCLAFSLSSTPSEIQMLSAPTCLALAYVFVFVFLLVCLTHFFSYSAPLRRRLRHWQHQVHPVRRRCGNDLCYRRQDGQHPRHENPGPRGAGSVHFNSPGRGQRH